MTGTLRDLSKEIRDATRLLDPSVLAQPAVTGIPQSITTRHAHSITAPSTGEALLPEQAYAKSIVDWLNTHYRTQLPQIRVGFSALPDAETTIWMAGGAVQITVAERHKNDSELLLVLLAQQAAHLIIRRGMDPSQAREASDKLPETIVILSGLGPMLRRAFHRTTSRTSGAYRITETQTIGKLSLREIDVLSRFRTRFVKKKVKRRVCPISTAHSETLVCYACFNSMRLPTAAKGKVKLTCRNCRCEQLVRLK